MSRPVLLASFLFTVGWSLCVGAEVPNVELGQSIFENGIGRDGREISGRIHGTLDLRGAAVACASCHGSDARGGGEAFVQVPDIRWHTLTKSFAPRRTGGARPAYTRTTFGRAIYQGVDPNNRSLDPAMPRFDLGQDEADALVSYLDRLAERSFREGAASKIVLGLLPVSQSHQFSKELGDRLNSCPSSQAGSRFLPLEILQYESPADALSKVGAKIAEGRVLSILAPYIAGWETQYLNAATGWPIVTLLPITPLDLPAHPNLGFVLPGLTSQVGALLDRALASRAEQLTILTAHNLFPSHDLVELARNELKVHHIRFDEVDLDRPRTIDPRAQWLVLAPLAQVEKRLLQSKRMANWVAFVPVMFFDPAAAQRIGRRVPGVSWYIAYPYQPTDVRTGRWRSPAEAWSEAGCTLMARMSEDEGEDWMVRHASIPLNSGMTLTRVRDIDQQRKQVVVQKWDSPKKTQ